MKNLLTFAEFINESIINEAENYDKISLYKLMDLAVNDREAALKLIERSKKKDDNTLYSIWNQLKDKKIFEEIFYGLTVFQQLRFLTVMPEYIRKFNLPNLGNSSTREFDPLTIISFLLLDKSLASDSDKQKIANGLNDKQKKLIIEYVNNPSGNVNILIPYMMTTLRPHPSCGKYKHTDYPNNGNLFGKGGNPMQDLAKDELSKFGLYE